MQIVQCEQGSDDWFDARLGLVTASEFSTVLASGRGSKESRTRRSYLMKLAGERLTGKPIETFSNAHMERGKAMENEARRFYSFMTDITPDQVGFVTNGTAGCSPDGLIGPNGVLEIKTKLPHLLIDALLQDEFPSEHKAQCQGALWITEREWIDLVIYWPRLPFIMKRAYRDELYIKDLAAAIDTFNVELDDMMERIRARSLERPLERVTHADTDSVMSVA